MKEIPKFIETLQQDQSQAWSWFKDWLFMNHRQSKIFKYDILSPPIIEQFVDMPFVCQLGFFLEFIEFNLYQNGKLKFAHKDDFADFELVKIGTSEYKKQRAIIDAFYHINLDIKKIGK